jgi:tripartite-type tricarboxylate transporter receptor subunit TctC
MNRILRGLLLLALLGALPLAHAQSWPARPIKVIVSFAAGSAPDIVCRFVGDRLSRAVGQQVIVDNRPGSGNVIARRPTATTFSAPPRRRWSPIRTLSSRCPTIRSRISCRWL